MVVGSSSRHRKVNDQAYGQGKFTTMVVVCCCPTVFPMKGGEQQLETVDMVAVKATNDLAYGKCGHLLVWMSTTEKGGRKNELAEEPATAEVGQKAGWLLDQGGR